MDSQQIRKFKHLLEVKKHAAMPKVVPTKEEILQRVKEADAANEKNKPIKPPTKENKDQAEISAMLTYNSKTDETTIEVEKTTPESDDWDVKIGDPIPYFDPELSYELTGYRPITKTRGLDFDPKLFTVAADTYRRDGRYTHFTPGTFAHRKYWEGEFKKCHDGVTIGRYRLTGENYFFLNYYRLLSVLGDKKGGELREENFPTFIAKQYEYFHYLDMVGKLGLDGLAFKSRGVGASEIAASNCAWAYTFIKASNVVVTAFSDDYVSTTLSKVWQELDFLNTCTEDAFRHVRMKADTNYFKRASKVDKDGNETGWMSQIQGIVTDKPGKLRGERCFRVFFEEAGQHGALIDSYVQGRALVDILGFRVGSRIVFGTANGESNPKLAGLKRMFYNPQDFTMLPYKHNYTRNGDIMYTGYFIPSYSMWFGTKDERGFDERGVVDEERAKKYYQSHWDKISDPSVLIKDKAEYCFTPEDAFIMEGSNAFNMEKLSEQQMNIDHGLVDKPKKVRFKWGLTKDGTVDRHSMPTIEYTELGHTQILEEPIRDAEGIPIQNLYVLSVDGIDSSIDTTTGQTDLSKYCILVLKRAFGLSEPKVVALYKFRPNQVSDAFDETIKLAQYYNGKVLVECTRTGVIEHFKKHGLTAYLMQKPQSITSGRNARQYGCPADIKTIERELQLINDYIENYYTQICFPEMVDELLRYSFENKRKFDIVAALGVLLLADEELANRPPKATETRQYENLTKLGYYTNEFGQIEFGIIPDKKPEYYGALSYYGRY